MIKILRLAWAAGCLATLAATVACDKVDDPSPVAIFITPSAHTDVSAKSGDIVHYSLDFYTNGTSVRGFKVSAFDRMREPVTLIDSVTADGIGHYDLYYTVPQLTRDSTDVTLTFQAWGTDGSECHIERTIHVLNATVLLSERTGIVLHDGTTGLADAIWLNAPTQTFCQFSSPDSVHADIVAVAPTPGSFNTVNLSSRTAIKFVRYNNFDYAAASALSVQQVWAGSARSDVVNDVRVNDIVLVGHGDTAEGVVRVQNVVRSGTDSERSITLSFKGLGVAE